MWKLAKVRPSFWLMDGSDAKKARQAWYEHKASYEYNRNTPEETSRLFRELGMVSKFWNG